jgi:diphosphomevalonate decarboxylase
MTTSSATAVAHPNIAFIKYWGNRDNELRLPMNGSISMNLGDLTTRTRVTFDPSFPADIFDLNSKRQTGPSLDRVIKHMNFIRGLRGISTHAHIFSENSFPTGAGIASSASAFAALTLAAIGALGPAWIGFSLPFDPDRHHRVAQRSFRCRFFCRDNRCA